MKSPKGLFCTNYGANRGSWPICHRVWCSKCYVADPDLNFHIAVPLNDEGLVWKRKKDEGRFLHARDGDMWLAPFQCQYCWFVNLKGKLPNIERMKDREVLGIMKRVNLDMFWSRATKTVSGNMSLLRREIRLSQEMELLPLDIARGPWTMATTGLTRISTCDGHS